MLGDGAVWLVTAEVPKDKSMKYVPAVGALKVTVTVALFEL